MKVTLDELGCLRVTAETGLESYALGAWSSSYFTNATESNKSTLVIENVRPAQVLTSEKPPSSDVVKGEVSCQNTATTMDALLIEERERYKATLLQARAALQKTTAAWAGTCAWHVDVKNAILSIDKFLAQLPS